jgi:hypothetical protein
MHLEIVRSSEEVREVHNLLFSLIAVYSPLLPRLEPGPRQSITEVLQDTSLAVDIMRWLLGQSNNFAGDLEYFRELVRLVNTVAEEVIH